MRNLFVLTGCFAVILLTLSCKESNIALIWTDRPEIALYGELFNTVQTEYKVSIKYYDNPSQELERNQESADIIIASWLKNDLTKNNFKTLDNLFGTNKLSRSIFYPVLMDIGRIDRNQYLLPVSFNLPAMIFSKEKELGLKSAVTIDFDEIKQNGGEFNTVNRRGIHTRMGFSPLWSDEFLFVVAQLSGSSFKEGDPLSWDSSALERSMDFVYNWTNEVNTSSHAEEDFTFRYFFEAPERLIQNDRILFSYINSRDFFTLTDDDKSFLDYRWITGNRIIPINEDIVFMGLPKNSKNTEAARAFINWLFSAETQDIILSYSRANRISENIFGICGGFSSLVSVTEEVFPRYYTELTGRLPPQDILSPPSIMPNSWQDIKDNAVLPYLHDRARSEGAEEVYSLERRLADWIRLNR